MLAARDGEARAQVIPEGDAVLGAGLEEGEEGVAAVSADVASGPPADCPLGDLTAGLSSTISNSLLFARRRASRRSRVAKPVLWPKMRSKRADKVALRAGDGLRGQALRQR